MLAVIAIIFIVISYLAGSVPFGLLVAKYAGLGDVRQQGSGNIGATNLARIGGKKLGAITFLLDGLKGLIPVLLAKYFTGIDVAAWCALAAVLGHVFPVWLQFKGGKGVATTVAVFFALDVALGAFFAAVWISIFITNRVSSLSAIAAMLLTPIFSGLFCDRDVFFVNLLISALVIWRHKENIQRLLDGSEKSFKKDK